MKSTIMNTMKSGADQCLQLSSPDTSHCINLIPVAHILASLYPLEMKCPMITVCLKLVYLAEVQKKEKKKKKEKIHIFLKTSIKQKEFGLPTLKQIS